MVDIEKLDELYDDMNDCIDELVSAHDKLREVIKVAKDAAEVPTPNEQTLDKEGS